MSMETGAQATHTHKSLESITLRSAKFISVGSKSETTDSRSSGGNYHSTSLAASPRQKSSSLNTPYANNKNLVSKFDATRRVRELCLRWGGRELLIPGGEVEKNIIAGEVLTRDIFLSPHKLSVNLEFGDAKMDAWVDIQETLVVYASTVTQHPSNFTPNLSIEKAVYGIVTTSGDIVQHDVKEYFQGKITEFRIKNTIVRKLRIGSIDKCKEFGLPRDKETLMNNRMCLIVSFDGIRDVFMFQNREPFTIITLTFIQESMSPLPVPNIHSQATIDATLPCLTISKAIYKAKSIQVDVRNSLEIIMCQNYLFLPASSVEKALVFGVDPDPSIQDNKYLELDIRFGSTTRSIHLNSNDALIVYAAYENDGYELKVRSAGKARKLFLSNYSDRVSKMIRNNMLLIQHTPKIKRSIHSSFPLLRGKFYAALCFGSIFKDLVIVDESFGLRAIGMLPSSSSLSLATDSQPSCTSETPPHSLLANREEPNHTSATSEMTSPNDTNVPSQDVGSDQNTPLKSLPHAHSDDVLSYGGHSTGKNSSETINSPKGERRSLNAALERGILERKHGPSTPRGEREGEEKRTEYSTIEKKETGLEEQDHWKTLRQWEINVLGYDICLQDIEGELIRQPLLLVVLILYLIVSIINQDLWICIHTLALFIRNFSTWMTAAIRDTLLFGTIAAILLARQHPEAARRIWEYVKEEYSFVRNLRFSSMGKMLRGYFVKEYPETRERN
eukprot:gb/GECH01010036.1/.p1 GENE.gb/GECH01010036.1/~~gb/GECH01010036.1/.p1  ORF type:complete len:730 (+),score=105.84 gb/GECH01010036.1/:1-2190(+)